MKKSRLKQLVRNFHENGLKLLLEDPRNVEELLVIAEAELEELLDFKDMKLLTKTFVKRDYRHIESDVVLSVPLRPADGRRANRQMLVYILIEHQSTPDRLMPLRVLDYVVQVFNFQLRQWSKTHASAFNVRLQPVLPVVFYTGSRPWRSPGSFVDLVDRGELFERRLPAIDPLFVNLVETPREKLEREGHYFSWVLRLLQQRGTATRAFSRLLGRVVRQLELLPSDERTRWLDLLSYIHALIYHERDTDEISNLQETVEISVQTDEHRQEVFKMGKSYAQTLIEEGLEKGREEGREEGQIAGRRQTLLRLLRNRFGELPNKVVGKVEASRDVTQLDRWLDRFANAETLDEVGIV